MSERPDWSAVHSSVRRDAQLYSILVQLVSSALKRHGITLDMAAATPSTHYPGVLEMHSAGRTKMAMQKAKEMAPLVHNAMKEINALFRDDSHFLLGEDR
jgi:hypothetical protein